MSHLHVNIVSAISLGISLGTIALSIWSIRLNRRAVKNWQRTAEIYKEIARLQGRL